MTAERQPTSMPLRILFDTDIGDDIDDAFALALLLRLPQVSLESVTTVHGPTMTRARIALKMLAAAGRADVPVYAGPPDKGDPAAVPPYGAWAEDWRESQIRPDEAPDFIISRVMSEEPGTFTLLAVGPLSNAALAFRKEPRLAQVIRRLIIMGGSVRVGYAPNSPPQREYNIACDPQAARTVFESGCTLLAVPLDATRMLHPSPEHLQALAENEDPLARALRECWLQWGARTPTLFDPMAVACALDARFVTTETLHLDVTDEGLTLERPDQAPNAQVATSAHAADFLDWYFRTVLRPQASTA